MSRIDMKEIEKLSIKSTMYLYGIAPKELKLLTHYEATYTKIESGKKLYSEIAMDLKELQNDRVGNYNVIQSLNEYLQQVNNAIALQEFLLGEME